MFGNHVSRKPNFIQVFQDECVVLVVDFAEKSSFLLFLLLEFTNLSVFFILIGRFHVHR